MSEFSDNGGPISARWHLNRGIPVVYLISAIVIGLAQLGGLLWYAGEFNARVDIVEKTVAMMAPQGERLTRLEEKISAMQRSMDRIEAAVTPSKPR
jgi:hypothetical protein